MKNIRRYAILYGDHVLLTKVSEDVFVGDSLVKELIVIVVEKQAHPQGVLSIVSRQDFCLNCTLPNLLDNAVNERLLASPDTHHHVLPVPCVMDYQVCR